MSLFLADKRELIDYCMPPPTFFSSREEWLEEFLRYAADIKPWKFGNVVSWEEATDYTLADYQVPRNRAFLVSRVECQTRNYTSGATDYGLEEGIPPGATAFWEYVPFGTGSTYVLTDQTAPGHIVLDVEELKVFQGGYTATLIGTFPVSPDGDTRLVRTLVDGFIIGPEIASKLTGQQAEWT